MSWGMVAVAGVSLVGSAMGSKSAKDAAKSQQSAEQAKMDLQREMFEQQIELLEPFRQIGVDVGLTGLRDLSTPEGQAQFYGNYYQSPQFQAMANQAQNQQLAAAEATGGLGSTSTSNQLARIAPELGMAAMQNQLGQYGQLANIGLSGAGSQASYGGQFGQMAGQSLQNIGASQAGAQLAQGQAWGQAANTLGGLAGSLLNQNAGGGF